MGNKGVLFLFLILGSVSFWDSHGWGDASDTNYGIIGGRPPMSKDDFRKTELEGYSSDPDKVKIPSSENTSPPSQTCSSAFENMDKKCNTMSDTAMAAYMISQQVANTTAQTVNTAHGAAVAGIGGTVAAGSMTTMVAQACLDAANDCIAACTTSSSNKNDTKNAEQCKSKKIQMYTQLAGTGLQLAGQVAGLRNTANQLNPEMPPPAFPTGAQFQTSASTGGEDLGPDTGTPTDPALFTGYDSKSKGSGAIANDSSGGGSGAMAGVPYAPGGAAYGQGGGSGNGSGFKDPDHGLTGGGGSGYTVSGVATSGGGGGSMPGSHGTSEKIDLSKFLPGGEMDPAKRGLASLENQLQAQGITGANDLSNFEKVSRAMNKKRVTLKQ